MKLANLATLSTILLFHVFISSGWASDTPLEDSRTSINTPHKLYDFEFKPGDKSNVPQFLEAASKGEVKSCRNVTVANESDQNIESTKLLQALASCPITYFSIGSAGFSPADVVDLDKPLGEFLSTNTSLQHLEVRGGYISIIGSACVGTSYHTPSFRSM